VRVLVTALLASGALTAAAHAQSIGDYSFENVNLGGNQYVYDPADPGGWTFTGDAGVSMAGANNPWFTGSAPNGSQAAFIQGSGGSNGDISQIVTGLTVGTVYSLTFYLADREGIYGQYPVDPIDVTVGGKDLGIITPSSYSFVEYNLTFEANSASELLSFFGTDAVVGDYDTNLDDVALTAIPEPASVLALIAGITVLGVTRRRRRGA
jgi:hypothetical protein